MHPVRTKCARRRGMTTVSGCCVVQAVRIFFFSYAVRARAVVLAYAAGMMRRNVPGEHGASKGQ
jgi:hypothetical protein